MYGPNDESRCKNNYQYYLGITINKELFTRQIKNRDNIIHDVYEKIKSIVSENNFTGNVKTLQRKNISIFPIDISRNSSPYGKLDGYDYNDYVKIGDSMLNPHFFSGSGVNAGLQMAQKLVESYPNLQRYEEEIVPIVYSVFDKSKKIVDDIKTGLEEEAAAAAAEQQQQQQQQPLSSSS